MIKYIDIKDIRIRCDICGEGGSYGGDFLKNHHEQYKKQHYKYSTAPKVYEKNGQYILICDHDWRVIGENVKCSICNDSLYKDLLERHDGDHPILGTKK